jgi:hypothetical protein
VVEAIGDVRKASTADELAAIYGRLKIAAEQEWASAALLSFVADPDRFLRRHLELIVEHGRPAELDDEWQSALASITKPPATAGHPGERP